MVIQPHEDQLDQVKQSNILSRLFKITNSVKQGCVLAPFLFTLVFGMMLQQITEHLDVKDGVYICFRTNGSLFHLGRLQAHTETKEKLIRELLFTDDAALVAYAEPAWQRIKSCFAEVTQLFGLEVSLKKTGVLHHPVHKSSTTHPAYPPNSHN